MVFASLFIVQWGCGIAFGDVDGGVDYPLVFVFYSGHLASLGIIFRGHIRLGVSGSLCL